MISSFFPWRRIVVADADTNNHRNHVHHLRDRDHFHRDLYDLERNDRVGYHVHRNFYNLERDDELGDGDERDLHEF